MIMTHKKCPKMGNREETKWGQQKGFSDIDE